LKRWTKDIAIVGMARKIRDGQPLSEAEAQVALALREIVWKADVSTATLERLVSK
jgi:hypothetical protein